jgi:hypothetical protein
MISIRDALLADSGKSSDALRLFIKKYHVRDTDGTDLGQFTWPEIVSSFSLEERVREQKASSLPWEMEEPPKESDVVNLRGVTLHDIAHLPDSYYQNDNVTAAKAKKLSSGSDSKIVSSKAKQIKKQDPISATFYPHDKSQKVKNSSNKKNAQHKTKSGRASTPHKSPTHQDRSAIKKLRRELLKAEKNYLAEQKRLKLNSMLETYLSEYSEEERKFIKSHLCDKNLDEKINSEISRHPERYENIPEYALKKRQVKALSAIYHHRDKEPLNDLMGKAHLFVFDDEAWRLGRECRVPLTRLPYKICMVEDSLIYEQGTEIKAVALTNQADVAESKRLLSFVVNGCRYVSNEPKKEYSYVVEQQRTAPKNTLDSSSRSKSDKSLALTSSIRSGTNRAHAKRGGTHRSPIVHYRRGYWRNQPYGPGSKLRKRIWISSTIVMPSGKPYRVTEPKRIHRVMCHEGSNA